MAFPNDVTFPFEDDIPFFFEPSPSTNAIEVAEPFFPEFYILCVCSVMKIGFPVSSFSTFTVQCIYSFSFGSLLW